MRLLGILVAWVMLSIVAATPSAAANFSVEMGDGRGLDETVCRIFPWLCPG